MELIRRRMFSVRAILVLLIILFKNGASKSIIKTVPGFAGDLPFTLETGYIGLGESEEVQYFYYFVESERNPAEDPLLLWLTGGPGCSGITGFAYEIGPLKFNYDKSKAKPTLEVNPYSWTKIANIIFLDAPVGTGFSYATTWQKCFSSDTIQAVYNYEFLRKWLLDHPEFLTNSLYISGDSYSGKIIPLLVQGIDHGNKIGRNPQLNLQGFSIGNPVTDEAKDINSRFEFAYLMGLISRKLYESAKQNCDGNYTNLDSSNSACRKDLLAYSHCVKEIYLAHILEPICTYFSPRRRARKLDTLMEEYSPDSHATRLPRFPPPTHNWCRSYTYIPSYKWLNDKNVQKALKVREGTVDFWVRCNYSLWYEKDLPNSVEIHRQLTGKKYQALIYSGDHDMAIPYVGTLSWIESLNLTVENDWDSWFVDGQVAGYWMKYYHKIYSLTYATVKGGGHTAPEYKPKECHAMIDRWLSLYPL